MAHKSSPFLSVSQLDTLQSALGFLLWTFVLLLLPSIFFGILANEFGNQVFDGAGFLWWLGALPPVLAIVGLMKMRTVVRELLQGESVQREFQAQPVVAHQEEPEEAPAFSPPPSSPKPKPARAGVGFGSTAIAAMRDEDEEDDSTTMQQALYPTAAAESKQAPRDTAPLVQVDWEQWVGQKLLQKVGILIVLIGMIVFLKYSFDNHIIGELGRIALSAAAAIGLLGWGEWVHHKYPRWSQAFTGGGLALLYFTVWAAHVFYHQALLAQYGLEISSPVAMILYSLITLMGALSAIRYQAQTIAWFTMLAGYLTPFLIAASHTSPVTLTVYLAILAGGIITLAWHQKWRNLSLVAFALTQLWLFGAVFQTLELTDSQQVLITIGFFILFAVPPLLSQFRLMQPTEPDDLVLILLDGVAAFFGVITALGGIGGPYVGLVCLVLAAIYIGFAAMALQKRSTDAVLVTTYLLTGIGLIALALYAQMTWTWVAAGWAPFSLLLLLIAVQLKRRSVLQCALALLVGSLLFLLLNIPTLNPTTEALWHPFTSHWALLSYVVFGSLLGWTWLSKKLPASILPTDETAFPMQAFLHTMIAAVTFAAVTFEATGLQWTVTLPLAMSYLAFSVVAILLYAYTRQITWFVAAFAVQILVLLFTFVFGSASGMVDPLFGGVSVTPFLHPWSLVSLLSMLTMGGFLYVVVRRGSAFVNTLQMRSLIITIACTQIWMHLTVEIQHMQAAFGWSDLVFERVLSGWWILFSVPLFVWGVRRKKQRVLSAAILALSLPFIKDLLLIFSHQAEFYEVILWTIVPILLIGYALLRKRQDTLLRAGSTMLIATMAVDMLSTLTVSGGFRESAWWMIFAVIVLAFGRSSRPLFIAGATLLIGSIGVDMLHSTSGDLGLLRTMWWVLGGLVAIAFGFRKRELLQIGMGLLVAAMVVDMMHTVGSDLGLLRTIWWAIVGLITISICFWKREQLLRRLAIGIFAATVIKLLVFDFALLTTGVRIAASILTGLLLIGASYLYQRFDSLFVKSKG